MIEVLAQISGITWALIAVAVVAVGANIVFAKKVLNSLNANPLDERKPAAPSPLANAMESRPTETLRTNVAAPRPRRLQPPTEVPAASIPEVAAPPRPVKLNAPSVKESELAEPVPAAASTARKEEKPASLPLRSETPVPVGSLVLGGLDAGAKAPAVSPGPAVEAKESAAPSSPEKTPPPSPATRRDEISTPGRKFFGAVLPTASLNAPVGAPPSQDESKKGVVLPHLFASAPAPDGGKGGPEGPAIGPKTARPFESKASSDPGVLKPAEPSPITPPPKSETPKIEQTGDGLLAVSGPAKVAGGPDLPPISAEEADDVKKKTPRTPVPEPATSAGLILIPQVEAKPEPAAAKLAEPAAKPAEPLAEPMAAKAAPTPAEPAVKPETGPAAEKAKPEPVLSPAVADILPAAKPEVETKAIKNPRVFLPGKFFGRGNKDKEAAEAKTAKEMAGKAAAPSEPAEMAAEVPKITTPASAPALVVPPVEEVPAVVEAKKEASEEAKPAAKGEEPPKTPEPAAKVEEPKKPATSMPEPAEPVAVIVPEKPAAESAPASEPVEPMSGEKPAPEAKPAPEKPAAQAEPTPEPKPAAPVEEKPVSAVRSFFSREKAPAAPAKPAAAPTDSPLPTQAAPTTEPIAEPLVPILTPVPVRETVLVAASSEIPASPEAPVTPAPAASIIQPQSVMPPNDTTTSLPNNGRASAQLTIGFEITSLQLTPFFKLGSVQLKALSNVVSLHLVAAQAADSPLAAGISFQIEHVDLDGASHLKSILLKPLGESRAITAPVSKLQVDNVAVTGGGDGSPISVTTSDQASTAVQVFGTFAIAAMDFTPAFEIASLRLEPTSNTVLLRVAPSSRPTALDLPPSFEVATVQLGDGAQITGMRLTPSGAK